ncbi:MAG TPA: GNAT family N-acetyltransferase [Anaerolineaceae bacterium]|nr:GNAT family N-acetyltransferase [Anaerolineaceae bacterium]
MINYKFDKDIPSEDLLSLYSDVGWTAYTTNLPQLQRAVAASRLVISAWEQDELIGLARVVGDGEIIAYVQDILVKEAWQNKGIGKELMRRVFEEVKHIRQVVLMTDAGEANRDVENWYTHVGFKRFEDIGVQGFARLNSPES